MYFRLYSLEIKIIFVCIVCVVAGRLEGAAFAAVAPAGRQHLVYYELAPWPVDHYLHKLLVSYF